MRLSFTLDARAMMRVIADQAHTRSCSMAEAAEELRDEADARKRSLWGIQSSWCVKPETPDLYLVTIDGPRQSLRAWCPKALMSAADAAHADGRLLEYDTLEPSWRPSWCADDVGSLIGDDLPTEWEDFDSLPIPAARGRCSIPYVRPRLLVGFRTAKG